jgi:surface carbohydrate biosynthesis protein
MLLLPVEIWHREGPSSILLALELASRGYTVCIGAQPSIQSLGARLPFIAVYLDKSLSKAKEGWYKRLPKSLKVISHDIEFTGITNPNLYARARFSQKNIDRSSAIIFHNELEKNFIHRSFDNVTSPPFIGSHKFEFIAKFSSLLYKEKVDHLRKKYGDFTFIPSNFGGAFREGGLEVLFKWADDHFESELCKSFKNKILAREKVRDEFIVAIREIAIRNPHRTYILRPHPTEEVTSWRKVDLPDNVIIEFEGPLLPYVVACSQLMHAGCTSVIDGALLNKKQNVFLPDFRDVSQWPFHNIADQCDNNLKDYIRAAASVDSANIPIFNSESTFLPLSDSYFSNFSYFLSNYVEKKSSTFVAKCLLRLISLFTRNSFNDRKYSAKHHLEILKIIDSLVLLMGLESKIDIDNISKSRCILLSKRL